MKKFIAINKEQIAALVANGCTCRDWSGVKVTEDFSPEYVDNTCFSGDVSIGRFGKEFILKGGMTVHSGISHATLHNVIVGDDCFLKNIQGNISNYVIGAGTYIENVSTIAVDCETSFGNGVRCDVLDETGGSPVYIHDNLSSHEAFLATKRCSDVDFITALRKLVDAYVESVTSSVGVIGSNVVIIDAKYIHNVKVGDNAQICGVSRLKNGTINSNSQAPVEIGQNVIADDFIVSSGAKINDGVMLTRCFVGQACVLGHGYTATDSLFFGNCQEENGEACALFAGPYTVTHHKSTLLIAGMFSFMNAGSGSNQSNHMYKLGPMHYGELERGAKTTSDSYILWPAKVGAFSLVMGRHVNNMDTSNLPFSYLIEQQGITYIVPGVNLKSVGTIRDVKKWPRRDKRTDPRKLDKINSNHLSPYTIQKILNGIEILKGLKDMSGGRADNYSYRKAVIRNSALFKGLHYYDSAVLKFLGNSFITRIENAEIHSDDDLRRALIPESLIGRGDWEDLSGLIAPSSEVNRICDEILSGEISDIRQLDGRFQNLYDNYYDYEWTWAHDALEEYLGISLDEITSAQAVNLVKQWKNAVIGLDKLIYEDARKEYVMDDIHGLSFEQNPFVLEVQDHIARKTALGDAMIAKLDWR